MKKSKFYLNGKLVVGLSLMLLIGGCSSDDDSSDPEPTRVRTIIKMDPPVNNDIDWNDVELVWNEEFDGSSKLDDIWFYEPGDNSNGLQVYQKDNAEMSEGTLKINAKENDGVYTSARLSSKYAFQYGRIEIAAKLPKQETKGLWAKMALIGNNLDLVGWPKSGEIDIMEYFSNIPNIIYSYIHSSTYNSGNGTLLSSEYYLESPEEEFHAYGILWTDKYIKFYIDNPENITYTFLRPSSPTEENWPFDKPFYLLTGMVVGGQYGGEGVDPSLFPASMEIDYIRVYHPE